MIDGVKLLCNLNPTDWTNNKNLSFHSWINTTTGEIPRNNRHADIKGLHLSIKEGKQIYYNARGSLHKYYNGGKTNDTDYGFSDFIATCELLQKDLRIKPETTILLCFEFGVNLTLPFFCSIVFECIKAYKQYPYSQYVENGKILGIVFKLQHYSVKIYDKGLQETGGKSQLMRFEIVIHKKAWINRKKKDKRLQLDIKRLVDLQKKEVWVELLKELLDVWDKIIFVDKSLCSMFMTKHNQNKYLCYLNSHYWINLNDKQYCINRNHLYDLQSRYSIGENKHLLISDLITNKCLELISTEITIEKGKELTEKNPCENAFGNLENMQRLKDKKREEINHLDKVLKGASNISTFSIEKDLENTCENLTNESNDILTKDSRCMNCENALKEKKVTAKFCTDKCRKAFHEREQTKANQKKRLGELELLEKVLRDLPTTNLSLLVTYRADGLQYTDQLSQKEIRVSSEWISQIERVLITGNKSEPPIEFTTLRAKKLIREIAKLNR